MEEKEEDVTWAKSSRFFLFRFCHHFSVREKTRKRSIPAYVSSHHAYTENISTGATDAISVQCEKCISARVMNALVRLQWIRISHTLQSNELKRNMLAEKDELR
jgi:hypothetical protein